MGNRTSSNRKRFNRTGRSTSKSNKINGVKIELVEGDITDETTDAIVNPTNASFEFTGAISRSIISKGGSDIEQECKGIGTLRLNGEVTRAGQLQCRSIIHVLSPSSLDECQVTVKAALTLATANMLQSISFPMIGCGAGELPGNLVASCIASEVVKSARENSLGSLKVVHLVAFNSLEFSLFDEALQTAAGPSGALDSSLPASWIPMAPNKPFLQAIINNSDSDYNEASSLFKLTGVTLHNVYRIQNKTLYNQFLVEKSQMENIYAGRNKLNTPLELLLYHGTSRDTINKINGNGFDRSYCGKNATRYGNGSYFAIDINYSADPRYSPPDGAGHKFIYAARVLVGNYCEGKVNMRHLPNGPSGRQYDSAVDDQAHPSIFVIFRDVRAYPLYLYEFT